MCLITYLLYLSTCPCPLSLPSHAWSFDVSFSIQFTFIIKFLHSKGAACPERKYKEYARGYGVLHWIGEQGYYVNTLSAASRLREVCVELLIRSAARH